MDDINASPDWFDSFIRNIEVLDSQVHDLPDTALGKWVWLDYNKSKWPDGTVINNCNIYSTSKKTGWDLPKEYNCWVE